jgi:hypothetical protein
MPETVPHKTPEGLRSPVLAPEHRSNPLSELYSNPFSDSFKTKFSLPHHPDPEGLFRECPHNTGGEGGYYQCLMYAGL